MYEKNIQITLCCISYDIAQEKTLKYDLMDVQLCGTYFERKKILI